MTTTQTNIAFACDKVLCAGDHEGTGIEGTCLLNAPSILTDHAEKVVRIRNPEHRAKAEAFWAGLAERRKLLGHCCRCGKEHAGKFRQCDPCRKRVAALKLKRKANGMTLAVCVSMVQQCRREVTKLREFIKQVRRTKWNSYNRGYAAGKKCGLTLAKYHDAYPRLSKQELAAINHAYAQ